MKGIIKLKVPEISITPKLFIITLSKNGVQKRFSKVDYNLESAIEKCWYKGEFYSIINYIKHTELSVDEINGLFKNFNP